MARPRHATLVFPPAWQDARPSSSLLFIELPCIPFNTPPWPSSRSTRPQPSQSPLRCNSGSRCVGWEADSSAFSPYDDNGGSILAIAGADFTVIAGDTRQTQGYSIQTRYARKVFQL